MRRLAVLLVLPFLHAELLQSNIDGADAGLWDLAISPPDAGNPVSDTEKFPYQNSIGLDDSISFEPSSLMTVDDGSSSAMFSESDLYTLAMDQCASSSSPNDGLPSKRLRTRGGAFCTNTDGGRDRVNQNPFLAGLDASESIIDPDNRRQCEYQFMTLCCDGPVLNPVSVWDCHPYHEEERTCWGPWAYYCCSALLDFNIGFLCTRLFPEYGDF